MRTLRTRIGIAFVLFAAATLVSVGGALWVVLRDLHRDASSAALAELALPYVAQARQRLLPGPFIGDRDGPFGRPGALERLRGARSFLEAAQEEIRAAGVSVMLARDDGAIVRISDDGEVTVESNGPRIEAPGGRGEVTRGTTTVDGIGNAVYVATPIVVGPRLDEGIGALVLLRADDAARLATEDLVRALTVAALVLVLIGVPVALWLSRSVARPLQRLTLASTSVARGQVPETLAVDGPQEVAEASAAFNAMAFEVTATRETQRQLLADLRHDLRTPLTVIGGFAEALRDGTAQGPAAERAADAIADEAARLERMLDDLDSLGIVVPASVSLRQDVLDAGLVVRETRERFAAQAKSAGQRMEVAQPAVKLSLVGDRAAIERILANLLDNAMQHAPSPGGTIHLEASGVAVGDPPVGGRGGWSGRAGVQLSVRDDGPGIPPAALKHVFDRFFRADPARSGPGSGLGLAIVRDLAEAQGGRAFAENLSPVGARVGVVLPAAPIAIIDV